MSDDKIDIPSNIKVMEGKPDKNRAMIEQFKRDMENNLELIALAAKMKRATYQAYIDEGFTPEQALELIRGQ